MIKLALIGDAEVKHYSVADRLWELISVIVDKKIKFAVVPLSAPTDVLAVFETFKEDRSFVGLEIAPPWRDILTDRVDALETATTPSMISIIYKDKNGAVIGANTGPVAAQRTLESEVNLYKCKSVLVIGANRTGIDLASHLHDNLDKQTYLYDPLAPPDHSNKGVVSLSSLQEVLERTYDLIINATPLGRYYFDKRVEAFTSPLDLDMLSRITHKDSIVQETNYLPGTTLLLQMANHLKLKVVTGTLMLVYEAVENLERYFGITLDQNTVHMLVDEITTYIEERESAILKQGA